MKLNPEWIVGFVDGEGCFHVGVSRHQEMTAGYQVLPEFTVVQHKRDAALLEKLKEYFGCGVVRRNHGDRLAFRVRAKQDLLDRIIPFFIKYPLQTTKKKDFELFAQVVELMQAGEHLSVEGFVKVKAISARMNRGKSR